MFTQKFNHEQMWFMSCKCLEMSVGYSVARLAERNILENKVQDRENKNWTLLF